MNKFREKSKQMREDLESFLEEMKALDPQKYQELVEAEANMYKSWLMTFHPDHLSKGPLYCDLHGGHGFSSDCVECNAEYIKKSPVNAAGRWGSGKT